MAKILVIEDDDSMNEVLVETLEDEGHEVNSAFNGKDAIRMARSISFDLAATSPGTEGQTSFSELGVPCSHLGWDQGERGKARTV